MSTRGSSSITTDDLTGHLFFHFTQHTGVCLNVTVRDLSPFPTYISVYILCISLRPEGEKDPIYTFETTPAINQLEK